MLELAQEIGHRLYIYNKKATGVAIYIRDNTLITMQKQCSIPLATQSASIIAREAFSLFERTYHWHKPIRSVTIRAFNLVSMDQPEQMSLFVDNEARCKAEALDKCVDALRSRYGNTIIRNACLLDNPKMSTYEHKVIMPTGVPR